jgi:hypothetical protein
VPGRSSVRGPDSGGQRSFVRPRLQDASPCGTVAAMKQPVIDEVFAREVASAVMVDVRTVRRVLKGELVRGLVGARIRSELARRREISSAGEPTGTAGPARPTEPEKG